MKCLLGHNVQAVKGVVSKPERAFSLEVGCGMSHLFCTHGHPLEVISHWFLSGRFWLSQSAGGLSPPADDDYHLLYMYINLSSWLRFSYRVKRSLKSESTCDGERMLGPSAAGVNQLRWAGLSVLPACSDHWLSLCLLLGDRSPPMCKPLTTCKALRDAETRKVSFCRRSRPCGAHQVQSCVGKLLSWICWLLSSTVGHGQERTLGQARELWAVCSLA